MAERDGLIRVLEASTPWERPAFRAGLAALSSSVAAASVAFAADVQVLGALAAQVPRCAGDESGATPWTSLRQEVAVARRVSGQAAAAELRMAVRLTSVLLHTLDLLRSGRITVARARTFVTELEVLDDELAAQLDCDLAERVAVLAPWRIRDEVRRAALALDPELAALRTAAATAQRDVTFQPLNDGQACVSIVGPAVPLTRWWATLDARARALRQAGDPRNLAALRFDLATSTFPCLTHPPEGQSSPQDHRQQSQGPGRAPSVFGTAAPAASRAGSGEASDAVADTNAAAAAAGLRLSGVEAASTDCRMSRPVQAVITVPVETALGLSNEPAWLDGYGWLDAPSGRLLLPDAELRRLCIDGPSGQVLDLAARDVRPPPTPVGVRRALLDLTRAPIDPSDTAWRREDQHDPSPPLRELVTLRDRMCDGPTQPRSRASVCDLDHDRPWPQGPTAAWNLVSRSRRTHQLKHHGWTPVRTATTTIWTSPAGQVVEVPHTTRPTPGIDPDRSRRHPTLPDPDGLAGVDTEQLTPRDPDEWRPWLPPEQRTPRTTTSVVDGDEEPPPF